MSVRLSTRVTPISTSVVRRRSLITARLTGSIRCLGAPQAERPGRVVVGAGHVPSRLPARER
jgi:hypothetical protein